MLCQKIESQEIRLDIGNIGQIILPNAMHNNELNLGNCPNIVNVLCIFCTKIDCGNYIDIIKALCILCIKIEGLPNTMDGVIAFFNVFFIKPF